MLTILRVALVGLTLVANAAFALNEAVVRDRMIAIIQADRNCSEPADFPRWQRMAATNPNDGYRVRFSRFGCAPGPRGALVILPGRGESSFDYYETAIDFIGLGFGPVYAVDHRGQGLSPRLLADPYKGHVARFEDYIDDFEAVLASIRTDLAGMGVAKPDLYLTTNSMGGAIAIGYFERVGAKNPFRAAALMGAMIDVNYLGFMERPRTRLNLMIYSETGALLQARWRCSIATLWNPGSCEDYAVPDLFGPYVKGSRVFQPDTEAMMTHSKARYDLHTYLLDSYDWSGIAVREYAPGETWIGPQLGGSTVSWVREAARFDRRIRRGGNLARMVDVPVLLVTGTRDLRGYNPHRASSGKPPDMSRYQDFCNRLNEQSLTANDTYVCQFIPLNGAFHELYIERDAERNAAIGAVDWFFRTHAR